MNILFLRFLDKVLNMVDEPIILFDRELNPVKANASGWRFFDACQKDPLFIMCEDCPARRARETGLACAKTCVKGVVRSEPIRNAQGALEGVVIRLDKDRSPDV